MTDYKITKVDTSVSPDGTYELVLQAVGEADWPFGSASGRLILFEGKSRISQADFEQFDEQIILYFDGRKERKQLTDKTSGF